MEKEIKVTGKHYRVMKDAARKVWTTLSFWTHAKDVEFDNNKRLQDTCGEIYGISSFYDEEKLDNDKQHIAASYGFVEDKLPFKLGIVDDEYGYYKKDDEGADTFVPFKTGGAVYKIASITTTKNYKGTIDLKPIFDKYNIDENKITSDNFTFKMTSYGTSTSADNGYGGDLIAGQAYKKELQDFSYDSQSKLLTYNTGSCSSYGSAFGYALDIVNGDGDPGEYIAREQWYRVYFQVIPIGDIYMSVGNIEII